jgi:hypothetical protein
VTGAEANPFFDDEFLWAGLTEYVHSTMGIVGIPKMLKAGDGDTAEALWSRRVRGVLDLLAVRVPVSPNGPARFSICDDVAIQFDIHEVFVLVHGEQRVRTLIFSGPAATVLSAVGNARWTGAWDTALAAEAPARNIVFSKGPATYAATFPWVAQNPGGPAPWTCAASAEEARRAGRAEDLGFARVATLFQQFQEGTS